MDPSSTSTTEVISTLGAAEGWVVAGYSNHEEPALIRSRDINANNKLLNVRGSGDLGAWVSLIIRGSTIFGIRESRGRIVPFTGSGEITDGTSAVFSTSTAKTKAMVAQDGMLYAVSDTGELRIIDARVVTGTSSLTKLPQLLNGVPNDALAIDGPFLYAASASGGVRIINISEAANGTTSYINPTPFFEDTALIGGRTTIANAGRLALTTTSSNTLEIVDPNPTNISVLFTKTPFFPTKRIFNLGSIVFTSGSSANFRVLELRR